MSGMFIRGEYGYLETRLMDRMVLDNKELGYKRKDILKTLKIMGVLKTGANRPYDNMVAVNGEKKRVYIIELAKEDNDTVDEEIAV